MEKLFWKLLLMPNPNIETPKSDGFSHLITDSTGVGQGPYGGVQVGSLELVGWTWDRAEYFLETTHPTGKKVEGAGIFCQDPL